MYKLAIITCLLLCQGCVTNDIDRANESLDNIEAIYDTNLELNNRAYYAAGSRDAFIAVGYGTTEAVALSETMADNVFGITE